MKYLLTLIFVCLISFGCGGGSTPGQSTQNNRDIHGPDYHLAQRSPYIEDFGQKGTFVVVKEPVAIPDTGIAIVVVERQSDQMQFSAVTTSPHKMSIGTKVTVKSVRVYSDAAETYIRCAVPVDN